MENNVDIKLLKTIGRFIWMLVAELHVGILLFGSIAIVFLILLLIKGKKMPQNTFLSELSEFKQAKIFSILTVVLLCVYLILQFTGGYAWVRDNLNYSPQKEDYYFLK